MLSQKFEHVFTPNISENKNQALVGLDTNITKIRLNMFPEIPDFFF